MRPVLTTLLALALLTPLAACNQTATGGTSVCTIWLPVSWSVKDTPETIDGVKANNARRKGYCE